MQGIEILNEIRMDELTLGMEILLFVCSVLSFGFIAIAISVFINCGVWDIINSVLLTIGLVFGLLALLAYSNADRNYWMEYEVTIAEDVKLLEFLEVYEIIDQEGQIFTVKEVE